MAESNGCNPAESSRSQHLVDYEALLQLFQCPVCCQYMRSPIYQCKKGHTLCEACRPKVRGVCPICKQAITNQTNLMMEKIGELIRFPCGYTERGCGELVPLREKSHHEAMCMQRPIHCHYYTQGCEEVLNVGQMGSHVNQCQYRKS